MTRAGVPRGEVARLRAEVVMLQRQLAAERHAACHDELTGLLNRRGFYAHAREQLSAGSPRPVAAMVLDLDEFKALNDTYGHLVGDAVLAGIARRLAERAGGWALARLGGDEFAGLLLPDQPDGHRLEQAARELAAALGLPMSLAGRTLRVRTSIGVAAAQVPVTPGELLGRADAALYRSKEVARPVVWDPVLDDDTSRARRVRPAVRTRDLPPFYGDAAPVPRQRQVAG